MTLDVRGWGIAQFRDAAGRGVRATAMADAALRLLAELPPAVLIGEPLSERALTDAAALDGADPDELPLFGVPYVVKDNFDVAGCVTTAGCPGFGELATADSTVVARLRRAGALVVGRTNMDQFATGLVGTRSPHGTPPNRLRPELVPGGSSSGSAVAVALGAVPFSLGTDTAGSGRVPAAFNGIVGLKPTLGSVSTAGIVPAVRRLDCPSVFTRSITDASDVLRVIAGADAADAFSRAPEPVQPLRWPPVIGVPELWPDGLALTDEMRQWFEAAVTRVADVGGRIQTIDLVPLLALGDLLYGSAVVGERTAAVGDAVERGVDGLDPVVAQIIGDGTRFTAVDAYRTEYRLAELRAEAARIWAEVDVIALPTTPRLATVDEVRADPFGVNRQLGQLTTFVNLAGAACVVVPMEADIPAGLQLVAPAWHDDELLRLAEGYLSGHLPPPPPSRTLVVVGADTLPFGGWHEQTP
jgi:allophanate hydrolase